VTGSNLTNINYNLNDQTRQQIIFAIIIGFVCMISGYIRIVLFSITADRQARTIKRILFQSILKKDVVFFDKYKTGELSSLLTDDVQKIRDGIGIKLSAIIDVMSVVMGSVVIGRCFFLFKHLLNDSIDLLGFIKGWKLTLAILSISPLLVITFIILSKVRFSLMIILSLHRVNPSL
jgi:ATP-binding cassette subfamily B (MDR/TAP) protein 1